MFPYPLGIATLVQGLYSLLWIVILMDVISPSLDLRRLPDLSSMQLVLLIGAFVTLSFAVGTVMHAVSRNAFRKRKDDWALTVLTSPNVSERFAALGSPRPSGGPSLGEIADAEGVERVRRAGEFMHAFDHVLLLRAPDLYRSIQVYRDQYRLARGFILPSLVLALALPFWEPVPAGHMGTFPLISFQLFFLAVFFAGVSMYTFRERSLRYAAAKTRGFLTLAMEEQEAVQPRSGHLSAIS